MLEETRDDVLKFCELLIDEATVDERGVGARARANGAMDLNWYGHSILSQVSTHVLQKHVLNSASRVICEQQELSLVLTVLFKTIGS